MSFTKYLLDKKIVSADQLVEASLVQLTQSRELLDILFHDLSVPSEELSLIILKQLETKKSIEEIQKTEKLIDENVYDKALKIKNGGAKSLALIFKEMAIINDENYSLLLKEFSEKNQKKEIVETPSAVINTAAIDSLKELVAQGLLPESSLNEFKDSINVAVPNPPSNEDFLTDWVKKSSYDKDLDLPFLDFISNHNYSKVLKNFQSLILANENNNEVERVQILESFFHDFYRLKGAARLIGASVIENLLEIFCHYLKHSQNVDKKEEFKNCLLEIKNFLADFYNIVKEITSSKTEEVVIKNELLNTKIKKILENLKIN